MPPCPAPLVIALVPLKCSSRNLQVHHRLLFTLHIGNKGDCLGPMPSIRNMQCPQCLGALSKNKYRPMSSMSTNVHKYRQCPQCLGALSKNKYRPVYPSAVETFPNQSPQLPNIILISDSFLMQKFKRPFMKLSQLTPNKFIISRTTTEKNPELNLKS